MPKHDDHAEIKDNYLIYMIGAAVASGALLVAVLLAFPNCPRSPPSGALLLSTAHLSRVVQILQQQSG